MRLIDVLGGPQLNKNCQLSWNGIALEVVSMIDSGAGGEAFIHHRLYETVKKRLNPKFYKLKSGGVPITGHNNQHTDTLSKIFMAHLVIDGHRVPTWFFLCDTGRHDVLIGRKWLEKTKVLVDCAKKRLIWPESQEEYHGAKDIIIPHAELQQRLADPSHQADADRRDLQMIEDTIKVLSRAPSPTLKTRTRTSMSGHGSSPDKGFSASKRVVKIID